MVRTSVSSRHRAALRGTLLRGTARRDAAWLTAWRARLLRGTRPLVPRARPSMIARFKRIAAYAHIQTAVPVRVKGGRRAAYYWCISDH